ncbi:MAG: hypothetical protein JSS53_03345, partial [Proteobacteria bacterium]|nr:hypothetical protein [Pseudomonadota bacterium]
MRTENNTPLYEATAHFMEKITSSNVHNNVLLFTDGGETSSIAGSIDRINAIIKTLASELSLQIARNKFYVFSYGVPQGNLMHQVAETFLSKVISTSSADFLAAQQDPETMKKWAAARELFTARIVVSSTTENGAPKLNSYALDLSGQLQALDPSVCNSGDTIETTITDGNGQAVVHDSKTIGVAVVPTPQLSNAALMSTLGIAPAPLSNPASGVATNTTASNSAPATSADTTATPAPSNPSPLM